ncbi:uncharacterized protein CC84DRAFT_899447 [Paraphaeosphaeria sporulosa]|uniref:Uncharacterized protein n=1 Tax=Paraphaeosphaeria sporulosa TaxID=1460663 RepID=A0A177C634_9PLEO|nr:uncharacterized protein CC84DRAFT_899447 [Paraphaeosphaeria sporulosa]OAG02601.1 hypothetical protein CC84DRAFT_899447 [Paraphaeosphaeria sporulosa]
MPEPRCLTTTIIYFSKRANTASTVNELYVDERLRCGDTVCISSLHETVVKRKQTASWTHARRDEPQWIAAAQDCRLLMIRSDAELCPDRAKGPDLAETFVSLLQGIDKQPQRGSPTSRQCNAQPLAGNNWFVCEILKESISMEWSHSAVLNQRDKRRLEASRNRRPDAVPTHTRLRLLLATVV